MDLFVADGMFTIITCALSRSQIHDQVVLCGMVAKGPLDLDYRRQAAPSRRFSLARKCSIDSTSADVINKKTKRANS